VSPPRLSTVDGTGGTAVRVEIGDRRVTVDRPVLVRDTAAPARERGVPYTRVTVRRGVLRGVAEVPVGRATLEVVDSWWIDGDDVVVARSARLRGTGERGFLTRLALPSDVGASWPDVEPFVPGVAYGAAMPVPDGALLGLPARTRGLRVGLVRADRAAAPVCAYRGAGGRWMAVLHEDPAGDTVVADGAVADGGDDLVDARLQFASLGGVQHGDGGLDLGVAFPGTEGEYTYSCGRLPLTQPHRWRWRWHPGRDGTTQHYRVRFRFGVAADVPTFQREVWRWAWDRLRPAAPPVDAAAVLDACSAVLAGQVRTGARSGIPLEADAVSVGRDGLSDAAVMGFVGANTDAGYLLLRLADRYGDERLRRLGTGILDSFTTLRLDPPEGEGFDLATGAATTYRSYRQRPAVYARSVAEGCLAMLLAVGESERQGVPRPDWLRWAAAGADWLMGAQRPDGSLDRAWVAGTGEPLDRSTTAAHVVVPFLCAMHRNSGGAYLDAALRAAEHVWRTGGAQGRYAGATLDNPDVVDKEAAVLAAEGFLDLFDATGDAVWLARAGVAATVAETWTYIWQVPMPVDADDAAAHWKRGVPTAGHQLIATGVSMADGFLGAYASVWARLYRATGDRHQLEVARLLHHGSAAMLALPGRGHDLRGPGWQQEHWSFAVRRGHGLNRRWLPWVAVAHLGGILRLEDLGPELAAAVLNC
jgi:hypothetical protein